MASDPRLNRRERIQQRMQGPGTVTGGPGTGTGTGTTKMPGMPTLSTSMTGAADGANQLAKAVPKVNMNMAGAATRSGAMPTNRATLTGANVHDRSRGTTDMRNVQRRGLLPLGEGGPGTVSGGPGGIGEAGAAPTRAAPTDAYQPGAEPTREAAPSVGQGQEIQGVSGRLNTLLDAESPYIQRARTRALQQVNRRGLLSSSIAAGAGEAAAIDAALPIAQADAGLAAGERQMRSQEYQQARDHRVQQLMQQRGFDHETAENQADRELSAYMQERGIESSEYMQERGIESSEYMQERGIESAELMQGRDHRVQQLMQDKGLTHEAAQKQADRELSAYLQEREVRSREFMQARDHRVQQIMQDKGLSHDAAQRQADRELSTYLQEREVRSREFMQGRDLDHDATQREADRILVSEQSGLDRQAQRIAQERGISHEQAMAEAQRDTTRELSISASRSSIEAEYQRHLTSLAANTQIPVEERRRLEEHYAFLRDQQLEALGQVHNTDVQWESTRPPTPAPTPTPTPTPDPDPPPPPPPPEPEPEPEPEPPPKPKSRAETARQLAEREANRGHN